MIITIMHIKDIMNIKDICMNIKAYLLVVSHTMQLW